MLLYTGRRTPYIDVKYVLVTTEQKEVLSKLSILNMSPMAMPLVKMNLAVFIVVIAVVVIASAVAAFILGVAYRKKAAEEVIGSAEQEATRIVNDAMKAAEAKKKETILEGKDELNRLLTAKTEEAKRRNEIMAERLARAMERRLEQDKKRLAVLSGTLWGLSPLKKLSQGYGFVTDQEGNRLASVKQAPEGSRIRVQVTDGTLTAEVIERQEAERWQEKR